MGANDRLQKILRNLKSHKRPYARRVFGKALIVLPGVFDPAFFDSQLLAQYVLQSTEIRNALDLGTGSGIQTIFIAENAEKITAVDINERALENARLNIELYGLEKKVELVKSDLFSNIYEKYDLIIFNPPFFSRKPKTELEKSVTDYQHKTLRDFLRQAKNYLADKGRILMVFSDIMDLDFNQLVHDNGYDFEALAQEINKHNRYYIYKLCACLIQPA